MVLLFSNISCNWKWFGFSYCFQVWWVLYMLWVLPQCAVRLALECFTLVPMDSQRLWVHWTWCCIQAFIHLWRGSVFSTLGAVLLVSKEYHLALSTNRLSLLLLLLLLLLLFVYLFIFIYLFLFIFFFSSQHNASHVYSYCYFLYKGYITLPSSHSPFLSSFHPAFLSSFHPSFRCSHICVV